jgi:hypothetical protein
VTAGAVLLAPIAPTGMILGTSVTPDFVIAVYIEPVIIIATAYPVTVITGDTTIGTQSIAVISSDRII